MPAEYHEMIEHAAEDVERILLRDNATDAFPPIVRGELLTAIKHLARAAALTEAHSEGTLTAPEPRRRAS